MAIITGKDLLNWLHGTASSDIMIGNRGSDVMDGREGRDLMVAFRGNDNLYAGYGKDTMFGGSGSDILDGGGHADLMIGGGGDDIYFVNDPKDQIWEFSRGGTDEVQAWIDTTLPSEVENLTLLKDTLNGTGNNLANVIKGNGHANTLSGAAGRDTIYGGAGNDQLLGGQDADRLWGDQGADTLTGGGGADVFAFTSGNGHDVITDFSFAAGDRIGRSAVMSYTVRSNAAGDAVITFSGEDDVTLTGVRQNQVNAAWFVTV